MAMSCAVVSFCMCRAHDDAERCVACSRLMFVSNSIGKWACGTPEVENETPSDYDVITYIQDTEDERSLRYYHGRKYSLAKAEEA